MQLCINNRISVDTPLSESRFADMLEGWVDEEREVHDEHAPSDSHDAHGEHGHEHDDHDDGDDNLANSQENEDDDHNDGILITYPELFSNFFFKLSKLKKLNEKFDRNESRNH